MFSQELSNSKKVELLQTSSGQELCAIFATENLSTHFQSIVELKSRSTFAFEALTRGPESSKLYSPLNLFYTAEKHQCLLEMDVLARKTAIKNFANTRSIHNNCAKLFINVSAQSLMSAAHQSGQTLNFLTENDMNLNQIVIEITESHPIDDIQPFLKAINHYRSLGFQVALDDLGAGYNGLKLWSELKPDYVKIDKHFVHNVDINADKYRFLETINTLAKGSNAKVIAEGVETENELKALQKIGIDYVQGFLFKRPSPLPSLKLDYEWPQTTENRFSQNESIGSISKPHPVLDVKARVKDASEFFLKNSNVNFLPVLDNQIPAGIVWRDELLSLLASQYGRDLHLKKPVSHFMNRPPKVFDFSESLVNVSREITSHESSFNSAFLITRQGKFVGVATLVQLLETITDLKVQSAKYANPLSGLPGNVPIQTTLQDNLDQQLRFNVIYVDVDNFKPYNDFYSFEQGDQVITTIASVLKSATLGSDSFIGHIGGDDFVILTPDDYQPICERILEEFSILIDDFYHEEDKLKGGISAIGRDGEQKFFPMMSLSLGVLCVEPGLFSHRQKLSSLATKAKKGAKAMGGNQFYVIDSADFKED
ncbi:GGDEF domain-containing protein [Thiomicrorhabdus indica]|uniref:GGDEF domain-containing protein n=1 Tax=Thiomicrorhabdus indica TaxID=2267253 RepID=UPI00102DDA5E|nr:bifunctional diguanylate cyclase/phosphodiesterase [Thiomicrorhabdus indica]